MSSSGLQPDIEPAASKVREMSELVIGILGGLGPEATVDFFSKLVARTPAATDQDHFRILIDNNPKVYNRNDAIAGTGPSPGPQLADMARALFGAGSDFLVLACNTAHAFEDEIRAATPLPFVSMIQEACDEILRRFPSARQVGILGAQGCLDARLYESALAERDLTGVVLNTQDQSSFMKLVYQIKSGDRSAEVPSAARHFGETLIAAGAEIVVAACTEVPLVLRDGDLDRPLIDSTGVLADRCIRYARRLEPLPAHAHPSK